MNKRRILPGIVVLVLGIALLLAGCFGKMDSYWSGAGGALIAIGILRLIRMIRYLSNSAYQEAVDTERNDERNKYLSMRAWSYAGYLFVLIAAAASIALKIAGQDSLMMMASGSVCLIMVIYWIAYLLLKKKY